MITDHFGTGIRHREHGTRHIDVHIVTNGGPVGGHHDVPEGPRRRWTCRLHHIVIVSGEEEVKGELDGRGEVGDNGEDRGWRRLPFRFDIDVEEEDE